MKDDELDALFRDLVHLGQRKYVSISHWIYKIKTKSDGFIK